MALYSYMIDKLNAMPLAYLHLMQPLAMFPLDHFPNLPKEDLATFGHLFDGPAIAKGNYTIESSEQIIASNEAQLV